MNLDYAFKSCGVNESIFFRVLPLYILKPDDDSLNVNILFFNRCYISNNCLIIIM